MKYGARGLIAYAAAVGIIVIKQHILQDVLNAGKYLRLTDW